mgnify:CR=1 FL=1
MSNLKYVGCDLYDNLKVRVIYEKELSEKFENIKVMHQFVYPYISGWYRGKWTHNPNDISKFPEQVQRFCKETWTDSFKENYKRWRESVGPWVE